LPLQARWQKEIPRQARLDSPGTPHHVIIRGIEKKNIVDDKYDRANMVYRLRELAEETNNVELR
jgi:putative transposase